MDNNTIQNEFKELGLLAQQLHATGNYDVDSMISGLKHMLRENNFFYGTLVPKHPDKHPSNVFYDLKTNPLEHQLVYVQLGGGYAKEMRAPHWCYVLKKSGQKLTVIPVTSIKVNSGSATRPYELDIIEDGGTIGRLHFDDIRSIDKMRIIDHKGYIDVDTPRGEILEAYNNYLSYNN